MRIMLRNLKRDSRVLKLCLLMLLCNLSKILSCRTFYFAAFLFWITIEVLELWDFVGLSSCGNFSIVSGMFVCGWRFDLSWFDGILIGSKYMHNYLVLDLDR